MLELSLLSLAIAEPALRGGSPIEVTLRADADEIRVGDPVLMKVEAVNRSKTALPFGPPLSTVRLNLRYECRLAGEPEYRTVDLRALGHPRGKHPQGFRAAAHHVSYDYLFRQRVWHGPYNPTPPRGVPERYVLSTEGDWEVRAVVVVGDVAYRSAPVRIRVQGTHPQPAADALDACAERLGWWFTFPTSIPTESDAVLFAKHLPALLDTPAAIPLRRAILLSAVVRAPTPRERMGFATLLREFGEKRSPIQREYTDLLLGVALVRADDLPAARALLRDLPDERSRLRDYIERAVHMAPDK